MRLFLAMMLTTVSLAAFGGPAETVSSGVEFVLPLLLLILVAAMIVSGLVLRSSARRQEDRD